MATRSSNSASASTFPAPQQTPPHSPPAPALSPRQSRSATPPSYVSSALPADARPPSKSLGSQSRAAATPVPTAVYPHLRPHLSSAVSLRRYTQTPPPAF